MGIFREGTQAVPCDKTQTHGNNALPPETSPADNLDVKRGAHSMQYSTVTGSYCQYSTVLVDHKLSHGTAVQDRPPLCGFDPAVCFDDGAMQPPAMLLSDGSNAPPDPKGKKNKNT